MTIRISLIAVSAVLAVFTALPAGESGKVIIGMAPSILADTSTAQQKFAAAEFPELVKEFTGLDGQMKKANSVKEMSDDLVAGKIQFAVFQGIEFAEAREAQPDLQPLLLATYRTQAVKALVVANKDSSFKSIADLRGKNVAVLKDGKEHIRRFVEKETSGDPAAFFAKVVDPASAEAALDAVLLGNVDAAIVDLSVMDAYREVNPGRYRKLGIVTESSQFPATVIAYSPKSTQATMVKQFQSGMLKANGSAKGRDAMSTFKITSFEAVPEAYVKTLASIRKEYSR